MAVFRGPRNLHLGHPVWAASTYDATSRDYVVTLEDEGDAERFRAVADLYGFREGTDEPAGEPDDLDGHEREFVDLAHAIDNARDDDELDDDEVDDEPEPDAAPAKPAKPAK